MFCLIFGGRRRKRKERDGDGLFGDGDDWLDLPRRVLGTDECAFDREVDLSIDLNVTRRCLTTGDSASTDSQPSVVHLRDPGSFYSGEGAPSRTDSFNSSATSLSHEPSVTDLNVTRRCIATYGRPPALATVPSQEIADDALDAKLAEQEIELIRRLQSSRSFAILEKQQRMAEP